MTDLPKRLREELDAEWTVFATTIDHHDVAPDGTDKLLLACPDGRRIECVLMAEDDRRTVCISTQVGCGMGCVFCASGMKGVVRNLTKGEILEQVLRLRNLLPEGERLTNLVVMGMGESLANLDNLIPALDWICSPDGLGMGQRRVTISTVGLPEKMHRLAELDRQYHLAVSLHAPTEALRDQLVPINEKVGLSAVMEAADAYFREVGPAGYLRVRPAGRRERPPRGRAGAGGPAPVAEGPREPDPVQPGRGPAVRPPVRRVGPPVRRHRPRGGVSVSVRKTKGRPIDAACGQLRRRLEEAGRVPAGRPDRSPGATEAPVPRVQRQVPARPRRGRDAASLEAQLEARDPDVKLMLQVRDDVPGAFEVLVERYQHRLVGVLVHLIGRVEEAEDLTQDVFLRIYRARKGYRPRAKFSTWLFTIANNLASNHLRSKGRSPIAPGVGGAAEGPSTTGSQAIRPATERALSREGTPSAQMRQVELSDVVREALDVLGEDQKMAVLLNKFEDMSYAEIAEVMGRSEAAVKSLLARARTHLRERLEPYLKTGQRTP